MLRNIESARNPKQQSLTGTQRQRTIQHTIYEQEDSLRHGGRRARGLHWRGASHRGGIDQQVELVCGAFSSDPERSKASGADFFLPPHRCYGTFEEMIRAEKKLPASERMDFVAIVTPNHMHFPPAKMALENGFHVLSDKPATLNLAAGQKARRNREEDRAALWTYHNYTGYPLVKEARDMISAGKLGKIRKVVVEYPQGWLATRIEASGQNRPPGALTRSAVAPRAASVTSARTPKTSPSTSPAFKSRNSPPTSPHS
jgi:predicted dehydrogenase